MLTPAIAKGERRRLATRRTSGDLTRSKVQRKLPSPSRIYLHSRNAIAKHYGVNGGSVSAWVKAGCPQKPNGLFSLNEVEAWIRARDQKKIERASLRDQKLEAEITKIKKGIRRDDFLFDRDKGLYHSKADCAASLIEVRAAESRVIASVGHSFKGAFPEASSAMSDWLRKWAAGVLAKLNGGG